MFSTQREYYIHFPESYVTDQGRKYPVLYVLHGQWDLLSTVAVVDAIANDIPELLIVGVNSKGTELKPPINVDGSVNLKGQQFKTFFVDELLPHIRQNYRLAEFSVLSGHSNSGRFVLNTFLDDPDLFKAYFTFSPSLEDGIINERVLNNISSFTGGHSMLFMTLANEGEHMQVPLHYIMRITYFYSSSDEVEKNKKASELVEFALLRDPASIDDFIELVEALNVQGQQEGGRRLTTFVCATLAQHPFCAQAQKTSADQ